MGREKESYRDNLELILKMFPGKMLLRPRDVAEFTGLCKKTVVKKYEFKDGYISVAKFARALS